MADEKTPVLPVTASATLDKLAAEDSRRHGKRVFKKKTSADDGSISQQIVLPVALTLVILGTVLLLPYLLEVRRALAVAGTISLYSQRYKPHFSNAALKDILLKTPSNDSVAEWLRYYTAGPHLAGQNYSQAAWTRDRWAEWGAVSHITAYDLYLNRPVDHKVSLLRAKGEKEDGDDGDAGAITWEVAFEASLVEDVIEEDPTTGLKDSVPTFHGYSASGNVTGPVVYVNYGTYQDYADLEAANVSLKGAVVIARYGGILRGLKVKRAQELGAVGALLYSDPGDDGEATEANGYKPYPDGPARQPSSVQRGSVQFLSVGPGDPTTPGYPSKPGAPRGSPDQYIPSIPSIPISYVDALPILQALNGHGLRSKDLGKWWTRNEGLGHKGVEYNIGPTPADKVQVNLYNEQDYTTTPIWNVLGVFNGSVLPNEVVVVGNHRDAWIAGGAVDPNGASAILNEVVRAFGVAAAQGWRPLRTIVFASWDGEEYGLLGSTEWVEEYLPWLQQASLAYVNLDTGASGPDFASSAVPLLHDLVHQVTGEVLSPNQTVPGQTVRDTWSGKIAPLGSGSDYTAFLDYAGITSVDVRFSGGGDAAAAAASSGGDKYVTPVYHYHSNYDSYHWAEKYGDPGFAYHKTMAQILGLLTAHLATDLVVPFKASDYADALQTYVDKVRSQFEKHIAPEDDAATDAAVVYSDEAMAVIRGRKGGATADAANAALYTASTSSASSDDAEGQHQFRLALDRLDSAVSELAAVAKALDDKAERLRERVGKGDFGSASGSAPALVSASHDEADEAGEADGRLSQTLVFAPKWWRRLVRRVHRVWLAIQVAWVNRRYQFLERKFLYEGGLDERTWFKHVVFAPGSWTGYAGAVFPGLAESIDVGNWTNAVRWADIVEERLAAAAKGLH
ncbi:hypothetical protein HMPREF1624_04442 [Sporothrix schenckii ATCC 58251]|uniref:Glutamate carboxypeptidase II n=1 Tax=Sporothrix schenckii (strain ATCC 58251 / de Perez 2211183) TaxID=1391915 RepID=U7PWW3_SPOS1|nr:hypothetical protein HMPREF1624_04442 [Sporothrix schenckii ATCC 58251]